MSEELHQIDDYYCGVFMYTYGELIMDGKPANHCKPAEMTLKRQEIARRYWGSDLLQRTGRTMLKLKLKPKI